MSSMMPSVFELGRLIEDSFKHLDAFEELGLAARNGPNVIAQLADAGCDAAWHQENTAASLALSLPATNLQDAAVQISLCIRLSNLLLAAPMDEDDQLAIGRSLQTALLSTLAVVCQSAGVSVSEVACGELHWLQGALASAGRPCGTY